jgi:hypothetical protein
MLYSQNNPLSSLSVRVDLLKPTVNDFRGNTLNDWLFYLISKQNEIDWTSVDISCLTAYSQTCNKDLKTIIELLIERVCTLQSIGFGGCTPSTSDCCNEEVYTLTLNDRWINDDSANPAKGYLNNGRVELSGLITGGSTLIPLLTLPTELIPTFEKKLPVAITASLPDTVNEHPFLKITTTGTVELYWTGATPLTSIGGKISLDGISYRLS